MAKMPIVTGSSEISDDTVAEIQPEAVTPDEKPKKKRNKPSKKPPAKAAEPAVSNDANDLYDSVAASVGAVVLDAGVLRIRASKVIIEADNIVFK